MTSRAQAREARQESMLSLSIMRTQDDISTMFDTLDELTPQQRAAIKTRYHLLMRNYRQRCMIYSYLFYVLRMTMTVGSLAVPALLSLPSSTSGNGSSGTTYWMTWGISLAVTTANGILTLFKLDKRFFMLHATAERLRTETWQYMTLSGRYSGHHGHGKPTHASQYVYYCSQIEKIHMKQIDEEFIKNADLDGAPHQPQAPASSKQATSASTVPTPADQASSVASPPERPRSNSQDTTGTHASSAYHEAAPAAAARAPSGPVQMHIRERSPVREPDDARITVLPPPPIMSAKSSDGFRTPVPASEVQP